MACLYENGFMVKLDQFFEIDLSPGFIDRYVLQLPQVGILVEACIILLEGTIRVLVEGPRRFHQRSQQIPACAQVNLLERGIIVTVPLPVED